MSHDLELESITDVLVPDRKVGVQGDFHSRNYFALQKMTYNSPHFQYLQYFQSINPSTSRSLTISVLYEKTACII